MLQILKLDRGWEFRRLGAGPSGDDWRAVDLPHTPFHTDLDGGGHWQGECAYRRTLPALDTPPGVRHVLFVGAAMHTARVVVDGREIARHEGGYLPFEADLTEGLPRGRPCELALLLDNRDAPDIPPGKPLAELDFCWFGGLYRDVELRTYPPVHVTEAVSAGETGGGGIFVRTLEASAAGARVEIRTHVRNTGAAPAGFVVEIAVAQGADGVAAGRSEPQELPAGGSVHVGMTLTLAAPRLWSPEDPALHTARVTVRAAGGGVLDERTVRFGVRRIAFSRAGGFVLNGRRRRLRGTNRHQEYPYVGYAVPPAAQRRDARRLKEAGFDYVRLSHYPQAPEFLDACDELGIVVMNAIPGWQCLGGERFRAACFENARQLVRRDRNHPCVVLWELSLNETAMDDAFMARLHAIGHEEFPGDQMFTCGWIDRYDVFVHSRQHGEIHRWRNGDKALVVAEYGDWEFYASNHGFDQTTGAALHAAWSNSRQLRAAGERGLCQQAWNHVTALDDTLSSPAVLDGQWTVFDYVRGYHPQRAACGVMDIFRLPKFSYHFYRSQRDAGEGGPGWTGGPEVFIASHWTEASSLRVVVFSNCEEVALALNGRPVDRQRPARTMSTQHLPHPPFVFDLPRFEPGVLEATGWIGGRSIVGHAVATPEQPARLELEVDDRGVRAAAGEPDVLIAHARICDARGTLCVGQTTEVIFAVEGGAELIGGTRTSAEAGIASIVLRLPAGAGRLVLKAHMETDSRVLEDALVWPASTSPELPAATAEVVLRAV